MHQDTPDDAGTEYPIFAAGHARHDTDYSGR
jgi:hypothetical protein